MLFKSSTILFSTAFIVQSVICLTLPTEFIKESIPSQSSLKEESSTLPFHDDEENSQENLKQAAIHARELIQFRSQGVGTLMSTFSKDHVDESLQGLPIGLQEYFAPFPNGDLLLLSLPISNIYHNIELDPNHSATLSIKDELASIQRKSSLWSANWRRISLFGKLEPITNIEEAKELYEKFHPDSTLWDGNDDDAPHESHWVRFKVEKVFYFGGFGDRGAIGWLDMNIYRNNFENNPEVEDRSRCFHPEGQNLYCDQPNLGPEINEIESVNEFEGDEEEYEIEFSFDGDEDEDEGEDEEEEEYEDDSVEDLENLMELWEELDEPVITQIINNNYITHHHHHHHRTSVSSSLARSPSASNEIIEAIEDAVTEMREELMEMTDELMEIADEMIVEKEEEEEDSDDIFSKEEEKVESKEEEEVELKEEETNNQKEVEATEDQDIPMLDKAFKSMGLIPILDGLLDLTEVDEDQKVDDQESVGVKFEVEI